MSIIYCYFVQGVHKSDAEELMDSFPGATSLQFFEQTGIECSFARCQIEDGQEDEFIEYISDDVMVRGAARNIE